MTGRLLLASLALCALPARAEDPERASAQVAAVRAEREARAAEASRLSEEIERLKAGSQGPRAAGELARQLRAFDRVARALDELDRRLARSREAPGPLAATGLQDADLRPLLEVTLEPGDLGAALETKLAVLQAERARGTRQAERLAGALRVLALRLESTQRLAREAEAGRRDAGAGLPLLRREAEALKLQVRELTASRGIVDRRRLELERERAIIEQRLAEAEQRRRSGAGSTSP